MPNRAIFAGTLIALCALVGCTHPGDRPTTPAATTLDEPPPPSDGAAAPAPAAAPQEGPSKPEKEDNDGSGSSSPIPASRNGFETGARG